MIMCVPRRHFFCNFSKTFASVFYISLTTSGCVTDIDTVYVFVNTSEARVKNKGPSEKHLVKRVKVFSAAQTYTYVNQVSS